MIPTTSFVPSWELNQGDPLLSYLFVLCIKGISSLFRCAEECWIHGVRVCSKAPSVSNLFLFIFFTNDSFIFCEATRLENEVLTNLMDLYELTFRQ